MIFAHGGLAQGVSFLIGGMILIPVLGPRLTLFFGCMLYTLSPILTYTCMVTNAELESLYIAYGLLSSFSINIIMLGKSFSMFEDITNLLQWLWLFLSPGFQITEERLLELLMEALA